MATIPYPHKTYRWVQRLFTGMSWKVEVKTQTIYLTFDDGPIPEVTEWVLKLLKENGVKATFFCVGDNIRKYPDIFKLVLDEGHSVGNHTFNHLSGWKSCTEEYLDNVQKCQDIIDQQRGYKEARPLFRPPHGRITPAQYQLLKEKYQLIMWDVLTGDFDPDLSPEMCLTKSVQHTESGSIITFHDSIKSWDRLSYTLPLYIKEMKRQGFTFSALGSQANEPYSYKPTLVSLS